jgi:hypothetical protein
VRAPTDARKSVVDRGPRSLSHHWRATNVPVLFTSWGSQLFRKRTTNTSYQTTASANCLAACHDWELSSAMTEDTSGSISDSCTKIRATIDGLPDEQKTEIELMATRFERND